MPIRQVVTDGVAVLTLSHPPVNALSVDGGVVAALGETVAAAQADPTVSALVIVGDGRMFCGGADIMDFDRDLAALDMVRDVLNRIEASAKPVVASIHGVALGGGLELALACHYRLAHRDSRLGLPEVSLGLLPGSGGTQRLPRLIDPSTALELMLSGRRITAAQALEVGLIDAVTEQEPIDAALNFIRTHGPLAPRPIGHLTADGLAAAVEEQRATLRQGLNPAPAHILTCVAAAAGPLDEGLALEARLFAELAGSEASRGLRHAFLGQRLAGRIPGLPAATSAAKIGAAAVIGGGLMGAGIALAVLDADLPVVVVEPNEAARGRAGAKIRDTLARSVQKGRLTEAAAEARLGRLTLADDISSVADADLIIEAVFEDMDAKRQVFTALDAIARPGAILASNTSTLDLDAVAACTSRPGDVVGLHFFSPANIMKLVEIVRGAKTDPAVLAAALGFVKQIGKVGVVAGVCDGFIGNRIFEEYLRQAYFLLEEGALPRQIDAAMEDWGMAMGPLRTMDLAGQDIGWNIRKRRAVEQPDRPYSRIPDLICEMGRFGQKTGSGYYQYPDGRTPVDDPVISQLILDHSAELGIQRRDISDLEIVERCLLAMINEGARIVSEGVAYRPSDVDIIYLNGYGFPAERGGPMFQGDQMGLQTVLTKIRFYQDQRHGWAWEPAALLVDFAESDRSLGALNA